MLTFADWHKSESTTEDDGNVFFVLQAFDPNMGQIKKIRLMMLLNEKLLLYVRITPNIYNLIPRRI